LSTSPSGGAQAVQRTDRRSARRDQGLVANASRISSQTPHLVVRINDQLNTPRISGSSNWQRQRSRAVVFILADPRSPPATVDRMAMAAGIERAATEPRSMNLSGGYIASRSRLNHSRHRHTGSASDLNAATPSIKTAYNEDDRPRASPPTGAVFAFPCRFGRARRRRWTSGDALKLRPAPSRLDRRVGERSTSMSTTALVARASVLWKTAWLP